MIYGFHRGYIGFDGHMHLVQSAATSTGQSNCSHTIEATKTKGTSSSTSGSCAFVDS